MDAIRMYSSGIRNVLALMGTAITKEQIDILKKLRVPIILMLDNDNAGELATLNIGNEFIKNNIETKVVRLKECKDPDEYIIKNGIDAFKDVIKNSLNYFDYKLNVLKENKNLNNTEELVTYVKSVIKMLDNADNLTKEITLQKLSNEYHIDYEVLKQEVRFDDVKEKTIIKPIVDNTRKDKYDICVKKILYYMMSDSKFIKIFNTKLGFLKNLEERNLVREIEYYIETHKKINLADFISYAENDNNIRELVNNISGTINFEELEEKTFIEYINVIKKILNREEIDRLKQELKVEMDINKKVEISKKILELKKGSVKNDRN